MNSLERLRPVLGFVVVALAASLCTATAQAQKTAQAPDSPKFTMEWTKAEHAHTINLRDMAPMAPRGERHEAPPLRLFRTNGAQSAANQGVDTALQTVATAAPSIGNVTSFPGVGDGDYGFVPNAAPPDTNLSVGATQVVQWVNESFAVFSKTGTLLAGPTAGNTLFQALGASHPCAVNNDGDPIAQYDKAANRWVLSQLSVKIGRASCRERV